jgi:hypothetical protein
MYKGSIKKSRITYSQHISMCMGTAELTLTCFLFLLKVGGDRATTTFWLRGDNVLLLISVKWGRDYRQKFFYSNDSGVEICRQLETESSAKQSMLELELTYS